MSNCLVTKLKESVSGNFPYLNCVRFMTTDDCEQYSANWGQMAFGNIQPGQTVKIVQGEGNLLYSDGTVIEDGKSYKNNNATASVIYVSRTPGTIITVSGKGSFTTLKAGTSWYQNTNTAIGSENKGTGVVPIIEDFEYAPITSVLEHSGFGHPEIAIPMSYFAKWTGCTEVTANVVGDIKYLANCPSLKALRTVSCSKITGTLESIKDKVPALRDLRLSGSTVSGDLKDLGIKNVTDGGFTFIGNGIIKCNGTVLEDGSWNKINFDASGIPSIYVAPTS